MTLEQDLGLIWLAKQTTDATLIAGGIEATMNYQVLMKHSPLDYIILGEGEKPLLSLCEDRFISQSPLSLREYREANLGIDFNKIPFKKFWDETLKRHTDITREEANTIRLVTSSHCPHRCTFCSSKNFLEGKIKQLTGEDIVTMVFKSVWAWPGATQIFFQDDNFLLGSKGRNRWKSISDIEFPIPFIGQARLDDVTPDILPYLDNFKMISVGIESFSQNILDEFRKDLKADTIDGRLRDIMDAGINVYLNIIMTSPYCTKEDVKLTIEKCEEWLGRGAQLGINLYVDAYPGTEIIDYSEVTYKTVKIPYTDITFKKIWKMLPMNPEIRDAVLKTDRTLEENPLRSYLRSQLILKEMKRNLG